MHAAPPLRQPRTRPARACSKYDACLDACSSWPPSTRCKPVQISGACRPAAYPDDVRRAAALVARHSLAYAAPPRVMLQAASPPALGLKPALERTPRGCCLLLSRPRNHHYASRGSNRSVKHQAGRSATHMHRRRQYKQQETASMDAGTQAKTMSGAVNCTRPA